MSAWKRFTAMLAAMNLAGVALRSKSEESIMQESKRTYIGYKFQGSFTRSPQ